MVTAVKVAAWFKVISACWRRVDSTVRMRRVRPRPLVAHLADAHVDHRRVAAEQVGASLVHAGGGAVPADAVAVQVIRLGVGDGDVHSAHGVDDGLHIVHAEEDVLVTATPKWVLMMPHRASTP